MTSLRYGLRRLRPRRSHLPWLSAILVFAILGASFLGVASYLTSETEKNPSFSVFAQLDPSQNGTYVRLSLEIDGLKPAEGVLNSSIYTLRTVAGAYTPATFVYIHLRFNSTASISIVLNNWTEIDPAQPFPQFSLYVDQGLIVAQNITFSAEYAVTGSSLFGVFPLFRSAIISTPSSSHVTQFYTSDTTSLFNAFFIGLSLPVSIFLSTFIFRSRRREILQYFPWLTWALSSLMIWGFLFIGTPLDYILKLGILAPVFSTLPHFSFEHIVGNLVEGFIFAGVLFESWISYAEGSVWKRRIQLFVSMLLMDIIVYLGAILIVSPVALGLSIAALSDGGYGASFTVEVWASLLLVTIALKRAELQHTHRLAVIYPWLTALGGYALLRYVYEWALYAFVYQSDLTDAYNHLAAFGVGIMIILGFWASGRICKKLHKPSVQSNSHEEGVINRSRSPPPFSPSTA